MMTNHRASYEASQRAFAYQFSATTGTDHKPNFIFGCKARSITLFSGALKMKPLLSCDRCLNDKVQCRFDPGRFDKCRGCTALDIHCKWTQVSKPQLVPDGGYISYLEKRVREVEAYLKRAHPDIKTKKDINDLIEREERVQVVAMSSARSRVGLPVSRLKPASSDFTPPITIEDQNAIWETTANLHEHRYYGHSSTCVLSRDAVVLRHDYRSYFQPSSDSSRSGYLRPEFWKPTTIEMKRLQQYHYGTWEAEHMMLELPSDDLMPILLNAYFDNTFIPVIHRQLFEKQLKEGVHKREKSFLRLVLLVCANGARWCNDPRVLDERWPVSRSAGYRWFQQFELWHMNLIVTHQLSLWDAQILVLIAMFFCGSSATYGAWVTIGATIRMMQDIGSHRRRVQVTLESELHKRCFWAMILFDRLHSVHFGRNGAIADSDFDLDEVLEVDDEFWSLEPEAPPPVQPPGIPSKLRIFNQAIALTRISGRCLQTVYALDQTKRLIEIDTPQGLAWIINDINSRLLQWAHSMPLDLQLPDRPSPNKQPLPSAFINMWAGYYELVISINRPFISKTSELATSCLAICREAAKGFSKMARAHCRFPESRSKFIPGLCYPAFSSAMVLAIDLILQDSVKGSTIEYPGSNPDMLEDIYSRQQKEKDMRTCVQILEDGEEYFQLAGKLRDVLKEFESSLRLRSSSPIPSSSSPYIIRSEPPTKEIHRPENLSEPTIISTDNPSNEFAPIRSDSTPQSLNGPGVPFDIFSEYEAAYPYFLASGVASGFPRADQLSNLWGRLFPEAPDQTEPSSSGQ
ncbi:hypothetical protein OPQ81_000608 [Rhizoctonia solani]|nr:hypothetical protein OPQ81_000608 [Rhizoctonia solani]